MSTEAPPTKSIEPSDYTLRMIRAAGHVCLITTLCILLGLAIWSPDPYVRVMAPVAAHMPGGHIANAAVGLKLGFSRPFLLFQTTMQDVIMVLLLYPWLVKGVKLVAHVPYIGSSLASVHEFALQHHKKIAPYGALGLAAYVFIPLLSTGPIVGSLIGYMIGLSTWANLTVVLGANFISACVWVYAYHWLDEQSTVVTWVILAVVAAIIGISMVGSWIKKTTRNRKERRAHEKQVSHAERELD